MAHQVAERSHPLGKRVIARVDDVDLLELGKLGPDPDEAIEEGRVLDDRHPRPGVAGEVLDLLRRRRVVDADRGRPHELGGEVEPVELGSVAHHQQHTFADGDAVEQKPLGDTAGEVVNVGGGERGPALAVAAAEQWQLGLTIDQLQELAGHRQAGDPGVDFADRGPSHGGKSRAVSEPGGRRRSDQSVLCSAVHRPGPCGQTLAMRTAVIVDAIRTPLGKRNGKLREWHPVDLAAELLNALQTRNDLDPAIVDDVVLGCVMQVGEQAANVARNAVLGAGWPDTVPGTTIDRQCGSSQQAAHFAAQGVIAGAYDVVVAGGVEVMTRVPMGSSMADGKFGYPFGPRVSGRYADQGGIVPQGISAELIADAWAISRDDMDAFGLRSQALAGDAARQGRFDREIVPILGADGRPATADEGLRDTTPESLAQLKPVFLSEDEGGRVTAGNSSQITDGASALLVMSEERAEQLGLTPRARFVDFAVSAGDPRLMLTATIPATTKVLARAGLELDEIDLIEINEAFASAVLAWETRGSPRSRPGQRQRRGDRPRSPARRLRYTTDGDAVVRARAQRWTLRPADHVRGRGDGQRHRDRADLRVARGEIRE